MKMTSEKLRKERFLKLRKSQEIREKKKITSLRKTKSYVIRERILLFDN